MSLKVKKNNEIKFAKCSLLEVRKLLKEIRKQGYKVLRVDL